MSQALRILAVEFPDKKERIAALSRSSAGFMKLANAYHALTREIRLYAHSDPASSSVDIENLRKMQGIVRRRIEGYLYDD